MMQKIIFLFFVFSLSDVKSQDFHFEQIAFDYFAKEICSKEYPLNVKFFFNNKVDKEISGSNFLLCFKDYYTEKLSEIDREKLKLDRENYLLRKNTTLKSNGKNFSETDNAKLKSSKKKKMLRVNGANTFKLGIFFVEIVVFESYREDHYVLEIDNKTGSVTRWCKGKVVF